MGIVLTDKQKRFCKEYIIDFNQTQAALRAGYSKKTAYSIGNEVLKKLEIQEYIKKLQEKREKRTEITQDMVLKEWAKIAFINTDDFLNEDGTIKRLDELSESGKASLASYSVKNIKVGKENIQVPIFKLHDKVKALDMVAKHLGMYEKDNKQKAPDVNTQWTVSIVKPKDK